MGKKVTSNKLSFVSMEPRDGTFVAFLAIEALMSLHGDPAVILGKAACLYEQSMKEMRFVMADILHLRANRKITPARKIWRLGDAIFKLQHDLQGLSLQLNGLYDHLVRDLGAKRKWLEKVIIFRRYLPKEDLVPESLNWGSCEKGTRKVAEKLRQGQSATK